MHYKTQELLATIEILPRKEQQILYNRLYEILNSKYDTGPCHEVDWNRAPKWAQFYTINKDGDGQFFSHQPVLDDDSYWSSDNGRTLDYGHCEFCDWRHLLEERPKA